MISAITSINATQFNLNEVPTWAQTQKNILILKNLNPDEKNPPWKIANPEIKKETVNKIANSFRPTSEIKLINLENLNLQWGEKLTITNEKAWINLEKINKTITEIEYKETTKEKYFIFRLKGEKEIELGKGTLDENLNYINKDLMASQKEGDRNIKFNLGKGELKITDKGEFIFWGGAKIIIDGREFVSNFVDDANPYDAVMDGAMLKIMGDSHFRGLNLKVNTGDSVIKISKEITDIIFKEGDYSDLEQYVQIYEGELKSSRADPKNPLASTNQGRILNAKGNDLSIELTSDIHEGSIDGENIVVKNGEIVQRFDGAKTFVNRKGFEAFQVSDLVNVQDEGKGEIKTELGVEEGESKTTVSEEWSCVGKFCDVRTFWGNIVQKPLDYELGTGEMLISQTDVFATESEVSNLLEEAPKNLNKPQFSKWTTKHLKNNKIVSVIKTDWITQGKIDENIEEMLKPLKLKPGDLKNVEIFKLEVYENLEKGSFSKFVAPESKITILSKDDGTVEGSFTITMKEKDYPLILPGRYIESAIHEKYEKYGTKEKPITLDLLYEKYKSKN